MDKSLVERRRHVERTNDPKERRELADTVIAEVMRHAVAEEMYVYPVMEKQLPNGVEKSEHDKQEHDKIAQVMKQLKDTDAAKLGVHGTDKGS